MSRPIKWRRILAELATGRKLTRFDAAALGDSVLPQTIHTIERATRIKVEREHVTVPGWAGCPAHVVCYWLNQESCKRAIEFLSGVSS